jgi:hypothetical protein
MGEYRKLSVAPPGWENTVKRMKKHPKIDNPWALSWWMKGEGDEPHKKSESIVKGSYSELFLKSANMNHYLLMNYNRR